MHVYACLVCDFFFNSACSPGRWDPPSCTGICDKCYNGGICDDKTGECVCRSGFTGINCLTGKLSVIHIVLNMIGTDNLPQLKNFYYQVMYSYAERVTFYRIDSLLFHKNFSS